MKTDINLLTLILTLTNPLTPTLTKPILSIGVSQSHFFAPLPVIRYEMYQKVVTAAVSLHHTPLHLTVLLFFRSHDQIRDIPINHTLKLTL